MKLPEDAQERKEIPIYSGFLKYFPLAVAAIAHWSFVSNEQHNPGQSMFWNRSKSTDETDALARHLTEQAMAELAGDLEKQIEFATAKGWRAMADLQKLCERKTEKESWVPRAEPIGRLRPGIMPRAPRTPQEVTKDTQLSSGKRIVGEWHREGDLAPAQGKMSMADYHDLSPAWFAWKGESDCIIRAPRDAGVGREYIVQFTELGTPNNNCVRTVMSDGPFKSFGAAEAYARENPNDRLGLVSICTLNPQEE